MASTKSYLTPEDMQRLRSLIHAHADAHGAYRESLIKNTAIASTAQASEQAFINLTNFILELRKGPQP